MKVGVTMVMIGGVVGEVITAQCDLGYIILFAASTGETATVLAAIVLLCGIGLVLFGLIVLAEQGMRRWYGERAAGRECDMTVLFAVLPTASLPMYNLPEMRPLNARFWQALRQLLAEAGLRDVPEALSFDRPPVPERIGPEILFSQTCGYPLETIFRGQAIRLGTPCYQAPGCDGPTHRGVFVVPAASPARELGDLRDGVFLFNHRHSNSGMNLPRRALADIADRRPLFAQAIETGSQPRQSRPDRRRRGRRDRGRLRDLRLLAPPSPRGGATGPHPGVDAAESGDSVCDFVRDAGADHRDPAPDPPPAGAGSVLPRGGGGADARRYCRRAGWRLSWPARL
jgi:hypothetical protein